MISAGNLMKRIGVGGRLVPFFKCVCVYFVVGTSEREVSARGPGPGLGPGAGPGPSLTEVAAKCAPVLCLVLVVALHHGPTFHQQGWYARRICLGLALSTLGDALLLWPQHFVAGMGAFALAHLAYLAAYRVRALIPCPALGAMLLAAAITYLHRVRPPPGPLRLLVPIYTLLLTIVTWRALARAFATDTSSTDSISTDPTTSRRAALSAAAGAVLFLVSDAILGYSMFTRPVPHKQVLVMSTYYLGQMGIALSALEPFEPPPRHMH